MIQDEFLAAIKKAQVQVTIYLVSGIRLQGTVESSDQYGVLLGGNSQQFIFKRAISTIVPSREVSSRAPPASTNLRRENPTIDLRNVDAKPTLIEIDCEKKEPSKNVTVVRVKRAGGAKVKVAKNNEG
jgi:host factor-I protein